MSIAALTESPADIAILDSYIKGADAAIKEMTTAASSLGAVKSRIGLQEDFVKSLMDVLDRGIGKFVDADMSQESTRLQALQVKQQLGVQSLGIANSSSQNILRLFQ
jgi:flagellin